MSNAALHLKWLSELRFKVGSNQALEAEYQLTARLCERCLDNPEQRADKVEAHKSKQYSEIQELSEGNREPKYRFPLDE